MKMKTHRTAFFSTISILSIALFAARPTLGAPGPEPCEGPALAAAADDNRSDDDRSDDDCSVKTEAIAFVVFNPGDPLPSTLSGVRYHQGRVARKTAIVLVHGSAFGHEIWDFDADASVARNLARAGYVVIAYDRLGVGASPYERPKGFGYALTIENHRDMLHQVVAQVKDGSYTVTRQGGDAEPAEAPSTTVVLIGHSAGGAIVGGYAGKYGDVAAVVQASWSNSPSPATLALVASVVLPQLATGDDYFDFFGGSAEYCREFTLYMPGMDPARAAAFCAPPFPRDPAGAFVSLRAAVAANKLFIRQVGSRLPVLLTWAREDFPVPQGAQDAETRYWIENCGCDVESWTQEDAGHAFQVHLSMPTFTDEVVSWLHSRGL